MHVDSAGLSALIGGLVHPPKHTDRDVWVLVIAVFFVNASYPNCHRDLLPLFALVTSPTSLETAEEVDRSAITSALRTVFASLRRAPVYTRHDKSGPVTVAGHRRVRAGRLTSARWDDVESTRSEVVHLFARVPDAKRGHDHREGLKHLEARGCHAEGEYILVTTNWVIVWQTLYVPRIIKMAFPFCGDESRIVLFEARKAPPGWPGNVCSPVRRAQSPLASHLDSNPTVNDGN